MPESRVRSFGNVITKHELRNVLEVEDVNVKTSNFHDNVLSLLENISLTAYMCLVKRFAIFSIYLLAAISQV